MEIREGPGSACPGRILSQSEMVTVMEIALLGEREDNTEIRLPE